MADICIQMGHCFRKTGATGTHREQEFASKVGPLLRDALVARGHRVYLIGADQKPPSGLEAFVALHTDGSSNPGRRGASVGYPPGSAGSRLAGAWKRAHQRNGYPAGFLPDNYTAALAGYYGFRSSDAKFEFLAEHGFTTNRYDEAYLFDNIDACVSAHVEALGEILGHPFTPVYQEDVTMPQPYALHRRESDGLMAAEAPGTWSLLDAGELATLRYARRLIQGDALGSEANPIRHSDEGFDQMRRVALGIN